MGSFFGDDDAEYPRQGAGWMRAVVVLGSFYAGLSMGVQVGNLVKSSITTKIYLHSFNKLGKPLRYLLFGIFIKHGTQNYRLKNKIPIRGLEPRFPA
jgi:hypothetical protein